MSRRIAIILGHPDPAPERLCRALAQAYERGGAAGGHETRVIDIARLNFPLIRTQAEFAEAPPPADIREAQDTIAWADHLVIIYPIWYGDAPALAKGFFEQTFRPGFALRYRPSGLPEGLLKGKSARIVVTMNMPSFVYRFYFLAHGLQNLKRNLLAYAGVAPIRVTMIGGAKALGLAGGQTWLSRIEALGRAAV